MLSQLTKDGQFSFVLPVVSRSLSTENGDGLSGDGGPRKPSGSDKETTDSSGMKAGSDKGGKKKGNGGSGHQWWCPKCGDPCTHVDTFVCKFVGREWHT